MRCPKCGSFLEEGKTKCFMCGYDIAGPVNNNNGFVPNNMNNGFNTNTNMNNNDFSTGMNNGFSNPVNNNAYNQKKEAYQNRMNDYKNVDFSVKKGQKKDIFDIYGEHKVLFNCLLIILGILLVVFIGRKIYLHKTAPEVINPIVGNLYYTVDDSFVKTNDSNDNKTYVRSNSKGASCSISVNMGTNTTGNHVKELYSSVEKELAPETDRDGNIIDESQIFNTKDSEMMINDNTWYYLNVYYNTDVLKYRYFTSTYKGYYYDIELVLNNLEDSTCNSALENFIKSLQFIES